MRKFFILIIFVVLYVFLPLQVKAEQPLDVTIHLSEGSKATIDVTYPVNSGASNIIVLPTNDSAKDFATGVRLVSARSDSGEMRVVQDGVNGSDASVEVRQGDKAITVSYSLVNLINSSDIGMFSFPLIFGSLYPSSTSVKVTKDSGTGLIFPLSLDSNGNEREEFALVANHSNGAYSMYRITLITYAKGGYSSYIAKSIGKYTVLAPQNKIEQLSNAVSDLGFVDTVFNDLYKISIGPKVYIVVAPFGKLKVGFTDDAGFALPEISTLFVDTGVFSYQKSSLFAKKVIIHELSHLYIGSQNGPFKGKDTLRWVDEGLAVFADLYISDAYLFPQSSASEIDKIPYGERKFTPGELSKIYTRNFDFSFKNKSTVDYRSETYTHAGTVFYNLFLRKRGVISQFIDALKKENLDLTCLACSTDAVLVDLSRLTGLKRDEIIYPFKNNFDTSDPNFKTLTSTELPKSIPKDIRNNPKQSVASSSNVLNVEKTKMEKPTDGKPRSLVDKFVFFVKSIFKK